jgi:multidrug resistance efflux pump
MSTADVVSDRRILVSVAGAVLFQLMGGVWWGATTSQKLADIDSALTKLEHRLDAAQVSQELRATKLDDESSIRTARIAVVEQKITNMEADINRTESNIASLSAYVSAPRRLPK